MPINGRSSVPETAAMVEKMREVRAWDTVVVTGSRENRRGEFAGDLVADLRKTATVSIVIGYHIKWRRQVFAPVFWSATEVCQRMEIGSERGEQSKELLSLARDGDGAALGSLLGIYRRYLAVLARTQISRRLQGKADASDLVQETLLEAHRHFRDFRGTSEGEFIAWLRSILAGLIANHVRRYLGTKRRDARLERTLATELSDASGILGAELAADISSPSQQAVNHEASVQLAGALEMLPDHYREVIMLRHLEGLPFAQVAERMGRSVESVEKLWVRRWPDCARRWESVEKRDWLRATARMPRVWRSGSLSRFQRVGRKA